MCLGLRFRQECEQQVKGFPGAVYRGFATLEQANGFINENKTLTDKSLNYTDLQKPHIQYSSQHKTNTNQSMKNTFYAVSRGRQVGIFESWYDLVFFLFYIF